ncbi:hypothetical protein DSM112329_00725 [Paraconexibacter sp. AEG42_29]|uniref:DUF4142 domain-containing protein n=1 Tax=Paraconexibacter sp. AEG42_29 TaxID=2997339 RepID=A0AAU7AQD8_9ACTN
MRRTAAVILAAGLLAGCGSDDEGSGSSTTSAGTVTTTSSVTVAPGTTTTTAPDTTVTQTTPTAAPTVSTPTVTTTTTARVTHAQYVTQVDGLCRTINAQTKRLNAKANAALRGAKTEAEQLAAVAPVLKEGLGAQSLALDTIKAVERPAADKAALASYFALLDQQKQQLTALAAAAEAGSITKYKSVTAKSAGLRQRARAKAIAFGFKECGSGKGDAA